MQNEACPSQEHLSDFLLGRIAEADAERISGHVQTCPICASLVDTIESQADSIVEALRTSPAKSEYETEAECQSALDAIEHFEINMTGSEEDGVSNAQITTFEPNQLGEYQLLEELGAGGMGTVYKARHSKLKKIVAVKILPAQQMKDPQSIARFLREMEAVGHLDHPNIVRGTDAGEADGTHFLAMEYIAGLDLSKLVGHVGALRICDACALVCQAAAGLQHAFEHRLVHRDIKPSNLMLSDAGCVKILDLGLARLHEEQSFENELTSTGQVMGSVDYMAPEQMTGMRDVDIRADIYSLGCTLFKLLTGKSPYSDPERNSVYLRMRAHTEEPVPSLSQHRPGVPEELAAIVSRMLAKTPQERFPTPADVANALEFFTEGNDLSGLLKTARDKSSVESASQQPKMHSVSTSAPVSSDTSNEVTGNENAEQQSATLLQKQQPSLADQRKHRRPKIVAIAAGLLLVLAAAVVIYFNTGDGQLVLAVYDPDVTVTIDENPIDLQSKQVRITSPGEDGEIVITLPMKPGEHDLIVAKDGFEAVTRKFSIRHRGEIKLTAELKPAVGGRGTEEKESPISPERRLAKWVLQNGGEMSVRVNGDPSWSNKPLTKDSKLPDQFFTLFHIVFRNRPDFDDEKLKTLSGFLRLTVAQPPINLHSLHLLSTGISDAGLAHLAGLDIDIFSITGKAISDFGVKKLAQMKGLVGLGLNSPSVSDDGVAPLVNAFDFQRLNLSGKGITDRTIKNMTRLKNLTSLSLNNTMITDAGLEHLKVHTKMYFIQMSNTNIGDAGIKHIASLKTLRRLELHHTKVSDVGLKALANLKNLSILLIPHTPITDEGLTSLIALPKLTVLDVRSNQKITNVGVEHISKIATLNIVWLDDTKIDDAGLVHLKQLHNLEQLHLTNTALTDEGLRQLEGLKKLRILGLQTTKVTAAGIERLNNTLPLCTIRWDGGTVKPKPVATKPASPLPPQISSGTPGSSDPVLQGIIPRPAKLPGIRRWQIETAYPRIPARCAAFSPDGHLVALGTNAGYVCVYDANTFQLVHLLIGHSGPVQEVAWSLDGKQLATGSIDGTVRVWNSDGKSGAVLKHNQQIYRIAWNPDGKRLATTEGDGSLRVWNSDGALVTDFKGEKTFAGAIDWSGDGTRIASAERDNNIRLMSLDGKPTLLLKGHNKPIAALAFSPNGKWLASGGNDSTVRLWKSDGTPGPILKGHANSINFIDWSPDGSALASAGSHDDSVRLWSVDGKTGPVLKNCGHPVLSVRWSLDGEGLVVAGNDRITHWTTDGELKKTIPLGHHQVHSVDWSPDSKQLATGSSDGFVYLNSASGTEARTLKGHQGAVILVRWSPKGDKLASGGAHNQDDSVRIWSADGTPGPVLHGFYYNMGDPLAWSPDGSKLAMTDAASARIWTGGIETKSVMHVGQMFHSLAWSPDGQLLGGGQYASTVHLWSVKNQKALVLKGHPQRVNSVAWSPDGKWLASGGQANGTVRLWQRDGKPGPLLKGGESPVKSVVWSPDGKWLAVEGDSSVVQLWDRDGKHGPVIKQSNSGPASRGGLWSPDSQRLAVLGNKAMLIYSVDGSKQVEVTARHASFISVDWSPDGKQIALGATDNTVLVCDAKTIEPQWVAAFLPQGETLTFSASGDLLSGDIRVLDREFVYIIQPRFGPAEVLNPPEFRKRFSQRKE